MPDFITRGVNLRLAQMGFNKEYLEKHKQIENEVLPEVRKTYGCPYSR
jgi:hypothetical protein